MLTVYINYPDPHLTIHTNPACATIQKHDKKKQRKVHLTLENLSRELARFKAKEHRFSATSETNDMWLQLDFADPHFERAVTEYVRKLLAEHYSPFSRAITKEHC